MCKTPILLLTFNRPLHAQKSLEVILASYPSKLYIFQDGPRKECIEDLQKCNDVRQMLQETLGVEVKEGISHHTIMDGECELYTNISDKNLGCGYGPVTGISWMLSHEQQGIIVEDDCILSNSAFSFYEKLLDLYKDHPKVSAITAANLKGRWLYGLLPYIFSTVGAGTLGCWATWSRVWKWFDYDIKVWHTEEGKGIIRKNLGCADYYQYYSDVFKESAQVQNHIWDYQWFFAKTYYNTYTIVSAQNQVCNIGFDEQGTHTCSASSPLANMQIYECKTPKFKLPVFRCRLFDWYVFQRFYRVAKKSKSMRFCLKLVEWII